GRRDGTRRQRRNRGRGRSRRQGNGTHHMSNTFDRFSVESVYAELLARAPENKIEPRMEPMRRAMEILGEPNKAFPIIHVTGTNGKTSTARMIESLLRAHGLSTGRYTS